MRPALSFCLGASPVPLRICAAQTRCAAQSGLLQKGAQAGYSGLRPLGLFAPVILAAGALFCIAVAGIANDDSVERAVLSFAIEHAVGNFATDRLIDFTHNNHLLHTVYPENRNVMQGETQAEKSTAAVMSAAITSNARDSASSLARFLARRSK